MHSSLDDFIEAKPKIFFLQNLLKQKKIFKKKKLKQANRKNQTNHDTRTITENKDNKLI